MNGVKTRVTLTIDRALFESLRNEAKRSRISVSALISKTMKHHIAAPAVSESFSDRWVGKLSLRGTDSTDAKQIALLRRYDLPQLTPQ